MFNAYYAESASGDDDDFCIEDEILNINHEKLGQVRCYSPSMAALTPVGNLYLLTYVPANLPTSRVFSQLAETCGTRALRLASWPQKPEG